MHVVILEGARKIVRCVNWLATATTVELEAFFKNINIFVIKMDQSYFSYGQFL